MAANKYKGGFRELDAWKEARVLRQMVIEDCKQFPKDERYLLTAQIKDSSRSVTANMAEGYGRFHYQEATQFFRHARGSLNETLDHYSTALDERYITQETFCKRESQYKLVLALTNGYIKFLQRSKQMEESGGTPDEPPPIPNT